MSKHQAQACQGQAEGMEKLSLSNAQISLPKIKEKFTDDLLQVRESEMTIKVKLAFFRGGGGQRGSEENCPKRYFHGKHHDNKILKVKILLSRNFVVMVQAPSGGAGRMFNPPTTRAFQASEGSKPFS